MQKNTELILRKIDLPLVLKEDVIENKLKKAAIDTLKFLGKASTNLVIFGKTSTHENSIYLFDVQSYPEFKSIPDTIEILLDDVIESNIFKKINFIIVQASVNIPINFLNKDVSEIKNISQKDFNTEAILYIIQKENKSDRKIIYIDSDNSVKELTDKDTIILPLNEKDIPNLKKYFKRDTMLTTTPENKKTIWDSLSIKRSEFDWISDIIEESKTKKRSVSETILIIVKTIRNLEFDIEENSQAGKSDVSSYELKLFLAGKVFEELIKK